MLPFILIQFKQEFLKHVIRRVALRMRASVACIGAPYSLNSRVFTHLANMRGGGYVVSSKFTNLIRLILTTKQCLS